MSANVECAGGGRPPNPLLPDGTPCHWKGERQSLAGLAEPGADPATAKPCPRCGGKVTLIQDGER